MQTKKMSLANIQGKLSRTEMKKIMAGSGSGSNCSDSCSSDSDCNGDNSCHHCATGDIMKGKCITSE